MAEYSARHKIPLLMPSQSQKHITVNTAFQIMDHLSHLYLKDMDQSAPPQDAPTPGDCYRVGSGATGLWQNRDGYIAMFIENAWQFSEPFSGLTAWSEKDASYKVYNGTDWIDFNGRSRFDNIGINCTADNVNRLSVKSDHILLSTDDDSSSPTGDIRVTINRTAETDTASILYKNNYSARAETGLMGDDKFRIKVSPDGQTFYEAITVDTDTGRADISTLDVVDLTVGDDSKGSIMFRGGSSVSPQLRFFDSGTERARIGVSTGTTGLRLSGTSSLQSHVYVGADGQVGIGHSSPSAKLDVDGVIKAKSYAVSALPPVIAGGIIFVSDETGGAVLAFSDGVNWRRVTDRAIVS